MVSAKSPNVRLQHILFEIDEITSMTKGMAASGILGSYLHLRAVERALQIISEAAKELPAELIATEPDVPWKKIIGIGNFLRHEYCRINSTDIQSILETHLPVLRQAVKRLIARLERES